MYEAVNNNLTDAQNELLEWIKNYLKDFQHSPSIRQMMNAMGLKSPAPIQSRLKHLQQKGFIRWQEGKARTLQIIDDLNNKTLVSASSIKAKPTEKYKKIDLSNFVADMLAKKALE